MVKQARKAAKAQKREVTRRTGRQEIRNKKQEISERPFYSFACLREEKIRRGGWDKSGVYRHRSASSA